MAAESASYSRIRSRRGANSASYSKMQQNARKMKEIIGSEKVEWGWNGVGEGWNGVGPAECAVALNLR